MSKRVSNTRANRRRKPPARSYRTAAKGRANRRRKKLIAEARARVAAAKGSGTAEIV